MHFIPLVKREDGKLCFVYRMSAPETVLFRRMRHADQARYMATIREVAFGFLRAANKVADIVTIRTADDPPDRIYS